MVNTTSFEAWLSQAVDNVQVNQAITIVSGVRFFGDF